MRQLQWMILVVALLSVSAHAQDARAPQQGSATDKYWQQLFAAREAQCGQDVVSLAKQADDLRAEIANLQKQLADKTGGK